MRKYIRAKSKDEVTVFETDFLTNQTIRSYPMSEEDKELCKDQIEEAIKRYGTYPNQVLISGEEFVVDFKKIKRR